MAAVLLQQAHHIELLNERVNTLLANEQDEQALNLTDNLTFKRPEDLLSYPIMARLLIPASLDKILKGHANYVSSVAFSPDNKLLASASDDWTVRFWNIPSGDLNAELTGHERAVYSVAFSPDGKSIVTGSRDSTVRTWSIANKQQVKILKGHSTYVNSVAWSPNGKLIASGSDNKTVILWDATSGSAIKTLTGHKNIVYSVSFSQSGNKLASSGWDQTAIIWDVDSGAALIKLAHSRAISSVCFSPDDQFVVTGCGDHIVRMFDANTGHEEKRFEGHTDYVNSVACSLDGSMIVSGSSDCSVRLWDVASTKQLQQLDGHTNSVTSVVFSCDGKFIASGSEDKTVRLWNAPSSLQSEMEAEEQEIDMNSLRECVCCQEIKDSSYLLPCLHPTCSRCVEDMVQEANQKKRKRPSCSSCGETFVQDKLTTMPSATLPTPTCFDCDEPATHYCGECKNNMCKSHDGHSTSKRFKDHVVRMIAEVPFCHKHSTETAAGFCLNCKVLVCTKCTLTEHNKPPHLSVTLQEATKTAIDSVKNDVAKLVEFVPSINREIQKYKKFRTKLEKERTELQAKIADVRSQEKVITLQIEDLENTKALLLTTQKQANTLAATATTLPHSTLVQLQSVVTSRVTQLQTGLSSISSFFH